MFETYCSEHVYGFGRFFAIIAKMSHRFGITAEVYLFGAGVDGPIFDGVIIKIPVQLDERDREFLSREAMMQAENMAQRCQHAAYKKSKDRDLILNNPVHFHKVENEILISIKHTPEHAEHLRGIMTDTKSVELSNYIEDIFSYSFEIQPYTRET